MPNRLNEAIRTHYTRADLGEVILAALERAGKDVHHLSPEDLAPIDQFHIRGQAARLTRTARGDPDPAPDSHADTRSPRIRS